ncbi:TetR-like C-terminal domain-containing protein [Nocardia sp. NPDC088792]|uniref:TetR-like C-terminal domain-containing protein n=1 Tax=Nocardia sp. NPDC088792 TaxID=3364332 RepID=UPI00381A06F4
MRRRSSRRSPAPRCPGSPPPRRSTTGIDKGELPATLTPDLLIDLIYGALYYRLLISGEPMDPAYADRLIDTLAPALRPPRTDQESRSAGQCLAPTVST